MHGYHGNTFRIFQDEVYRKDCLIPISITKITELQYMYLKQEVKELIVYNSEMDRMSI